MVAKELVEAVRKNATIYWAVKESARAKLRVIVRRLSRKHGYPPDKQEKATQTVLKQAELLCGSGRAKSKKTRQFQKTQHENHCYHQGN